MKLVSPNQEVLKCWFLSLIGWFANKMYHFFVLSRFISVFYYVSPSVGMFEGKAYQVVARYNCPLGEFSLRLFLIISVFSKNGNVGLWKCFMFRNN